MIPSLPDGLPPGQFETAGVWLSDEPLGGPVGLWRHCQAWQEATGWRPLLCWADASSGRPRDLAEVDAVSLETTLAVDFAAYRASWLAAEAEPAPPLYVPEGIEPWPDDPGPPFERWPGLAAGIVPDAGSFDPDGVAAWAVGRLFAEQPHLLADCQLALVRARRSADVPAVIGWQAEAPLPLLCALLRSWEDRFGARVFAAFGGTLYVSVARPPRDEAHANHLAVEHLLSTADNIVSDPPTPFPDYAAELVGRHEWSFWWD
jgi:hypothetical protein